VLDDSVFVHPVAHFRCGRTDGTIFPLPHASSQVTKHEQFRHGAIRFRERLGGLLKYYDREAA
jgi:hypothetical protein